MLLMQQAHFMLHGHHQRFACVHKANAGQRLHLGIFGRHTSLQVPSYRRRHHGLQWRSVQAAAATDTAQKQGPPKKEQVPTDGVDTLPVSSTVTMLRHVCKRRLKMEVEYGLKRGTTDNSYLIQEGQRYVLVDIPQEPFLDDFVSSLERFVSLQEIEHVIITHLAPNRLACIKAFLERRSSKQGAAQLTITLSNPALQLLRENFGIAAPSKAPEGSQNEKVDAAAHNMQDSDPSKGQGSRPPQFGDSAHLLDGIKLVAAKSGSTLKLSETHVLQLLPVPTPRWPDLLCVYSPEDNLLFSSKLFSAHVAPSLAGTSGEAAVDVGGWDVFGTDWRHFFDCMLAPVAKQAAGALDRLGEVISPSAEDTPVVDGLLNSVQRAVKSVQAKLEASQAATFGKGLIGYTLTGRPLAVAALCPLHGPVVQTSVTELLRQYQSWTLEQIKRSDELHIAVLYASAYGNTAGMAQAISRGITKAGVGVETVNLEVESTDDAVKAVVDSGGFVIGSPTLGGHMPTQVQTTLGALLREPKAREMPCGVFGSFGWSGEAVDQLESRLKDAGFQQAFQPIRVKFKPSAKDVQVCEESGTDLAQAVRKKARKVQRQAGSGSGKSGGGLEAATGRLVGALCVVTGRDDDAQSAMLASWVAQASFDPPGVTVAVKKDRAVEPLMVLGNKFILNVLAQGKEKAAIKQLSKPFKPAQDRFEGVATEVDEDSGCVILKEAASYVTCSIKDRIEAGDHWIVYATVDSGKVLAPDAQTAVHHRKAGNHY